ncbi:MAG: DUF6056 family protein [Kofleriaceae bacterium]
MAAFALWLVFFVQAINTPFILDDWFQLRYWRDHEFGLVNLWAFARHNYIHYNPRIGEVWLAVVDGSPALHAIVTPLVQLGLLVFAFVVAFARWPRRSDLPLLLFLQTMIWVVIPLPGLMYFYRPYATNYLWGFTTTLALCVPYRLGVVGRKYILPMLVLGWLAGMCNEHTGPTAIVVVSAFVVVALRRRTSQPWMFAGLVGVIVGYAMLFFAPGQTARYGGIANQATPLHMLAHRGVMGCAWIVRELVYESRLGILMFLAVVVSYLMTGPSRPTRATWLAAGGLAAASACIIATLFFSPTTIDRMYVASGVLLAAAFTVLAEHMFREPVVKWFVTCACFVVFAFHVERFITTTHEVKVENEARIEAMQTARPGSIVVVPTYSHPDRSRWVFGDDLAHFPWFREYVAGELFGLARVDLDHLDKTPPAELVTTATYDPPARPPAVPSPTYRQLLDAPDAWTLAAPELPGHTLVHVTIEAHGLFVDSQRRPVIVFDGTPQEHTLIDGRPYDDARGHFIRVRDRAAATGFDWFVLGCGERQHVTPVVDGRDALLPVDESNCRGPFTAIACDDARCWVAGWY